MTNHSKSHCHPELVEGSQSKFQIERHPELGSGSNPSSIDELHKNIFHKGGQVLEVAEIVEQVLPTFADRHAAPDQR